MLKIFFGEMKDVNYGPCWFKNNYNPEWLKDKFVQSMIEDVDKARCIDGYVIDSPVFGSIPPEWLTGGLQTLIMIYVRPDLVFDATSCGQNCAKWLADIGRLKDVTINLNYIMHLERIPDFEAYIVNEEKLVTTAKEYVYTALKYV